MQKHTHRRGLSQQIPHSLKNKDNCKQLIDFKHNYAFSSQHTRSTALTVYKNKDKDKDKYKDKDNDRGKQKDKDKNMSKEKKYRKQIRKIQMQWRQDQVPYTPEFVVRNYGHLLEPAQRMEVRQYRNIYFIVNKEREAQSSTEIKKLEQQGFLPYKVGRHIAYRYQILEKINRGSFGQVLKVYDHKTKQFQALKIVKKQPQLVKQTFIQISILTNIKEKDKGDVSGIIRIKDFTIFREHICIGFELLDANLYELLHANQFKGLSESFVRIFAIQMLNSLNFLQKMNIVHCDVKPENFVLKTWGKSGIKLIDFGTSCYQDQQVYTYIQSRYYRAPEILFQRYYTTSIDMWSFGCLIVELSLGKPLFPGNSDLHQLAYMVGLLGYPDSQFSVKRATEIQRIRVNKYLEKDQNGKLSKSALEKFEKDTGSRLDPDCLGTFQQRFHSLDPAFIHFLKQILKWDPKDRITPAQALQHPWIVSGLPEQIRQLYTIYENISKGENIQMPKKKKRTKSKSKSKSRQRSQQKNQSITKMKGTSNKSNVNFMKYESKTLKIDLPYALTTKTKSKTSQQKSRNQKQNKSPVSAKRKKN